MGWGCLGLLDFRKPEVAIVDFDDMVKVKAAGSQEPVGSTSEHSA